MSDTDYVEWPEFVIFHQSSVIIKILRRMTHDKKIPRYEPYMDVETDFSAACQLVKRLNGDE